MTKSDDMINLHVRINPADLWSACIDLVTVNALPLSVVEYPAFKRILFPYIFALHRQGIELIINRQNIKKRIERRAQQIKEVIMSQVKNKMISILVDIASRFNRSVLGINIAYMIDGKICIRSIGMHTLRFSHTAVNIVNIIKKNLEEFQIGLNQVIDLLLRTLTFYKLQ